MSSKKRIFRWAFLAFFIILIIVVAIWLKMGDNKLDKQMEQEKEHAEVWVARDINVFFYGFEKNSVSPIFIQKIRDGHVIDTFTLFDNGKGVINIDNRNLKLTDSLVLILASKEKYTINGFENYYYKHHSGFGATGGGDYRFFRAKVNGILDTVGGESVNIIKK